MSEWNKQTLDQVAAALFLLWMALLLPWLILAPLSGMMLDAGPNFAVYLFIGSIWTYPVSVGIVWKFRQITPLVALLPFVNIAISFIAGLAA